MSFFCLTMLASKQFHISNWRMTFLIPPCDTVLFSDSEDSSTLIPLAQGPAHRLVFDPFLICAALVYALYYLDYWPVPLWVLWSPKCPPYFQFPVRRRGIHWLDGTFLSWSPMVPQTKPGRLPLTEDFSVLEWIKPFSTVLVYPFDFMALLTPVSPPAVSGTVSCCLSTGEVALWPLITSQWSSLFQVFV